jgi:hypothetical protein
MKELGKKKKKARWVDKKGGKESVQNTHVEKNIQFFFSLGVVHSHHPPLFSNIKRRTKKQYKGQVILPFPKLKNLQSAVEVPFFLSFQFWIKNFSPLFPPLTMHLCHLNR